jgi:hypothetical protein
MNRPLIYFTSTLLLLMAATLSVPAQETNVALDNTSMNNTTMNNTTSNSILNLTAINGTDLNNTNSVSAPNGTSLSEPSANETAMNSAIAPQNLTSPANSSAEVKPADNLSENAAENVQAAPAAQEGTLEKNSFTIGTGLQSGKVFVVNGNAKPKQTFEAGIPIKPLRDTSKMYFVCDIV